MKKIKEMKPGAKKQILGGLVYMALAVTVVAVTIGSVVNSFSQNDAEITKKGNSSDTNNGNYTLKLPESYNSGFDPDSFNLDTPVSDSQTGVNSQVVIPDTVSGTDNIKHPCTD